MPIVRRLMLSLALVITAVAGLFTYIQTERQKERLYGEMDHRALVVGDTLIESLREPLAKRDLTALRALTEKFADIQLMRGIVVYDEKGRALVSSPNLKIYEVSPPRHIQIALAADAVQKTIQTSGPTQDHLFVHPIYNDGRHLGALLVVHDTSFVRDTVKDIWKENVVRFVVLILLILGTAYAVTHVSFLKPLSHTAEWVKKLRLNADDFDWSHAPHKELFGPLAKEVRQMAESLTQARAAAEEEAKLRQASESQWTPERLKEHMRNTLEGRPLFVVANREPYVHTRVGKEIRAIVPASGLVTALEPILKSCGGVWIGHGAGDADRDTVDDKDHVRVPPEEPMYTLRRVWMNREEENGYYYGFSNEGLWPLCHIAHTRPVFRAEDWAQYKKVNERFAEAAIEEMKETENPFVLIQDYHFALLPRLIKEKRPDARVAVFWHIPWPNPESFGICPWQRDILNGLLGADLLGFHIQYHCNNFLETVDRALESRIDWAQFSVWREKHKTFVKPFPISVASAAPKPFAEKHEDSKTLKAKIFKTLGVNAEYLGVGVDRIDYTKGILERLRSVERFIEKYPAFYGKFTFVELGAPSRTLIPTYNALDAEIEAEVLRINNKMKTKEWRPIVLLKEHHNHTEIDMYYKAADLCLVTSLHDGMNLVAKEFVVAKDDRDGALILSRFAGAAQELRDALIVNPYDIEQVADAISYGLNMDENEKRKRMTRMQETVRDNNIYRWASDLITTLAQLRLDKASAKA